MSNQSHRRPRVGSRHRPAPLLYVDGWYSERADALDVLGFVLGLDGVSDALLIESDGTFGLVYCSTVEHFASHRRFAARIAWTRGRD